MSTRITSRQVNQLPVVGLEELQGVYSLDELEELKNSVPVFSSFGGLAIRVAEADRLDITEDVNSATRLYDQFDLYIQASNHIFAAVSALKLVGLTVDDLDPDIRSIIDEINPSRQSIKRLRKNVIERMFKEITDKPELLPKDNKGDSN